MSINQSRAEKTDSAQYKKLGRSGSSGQQWNFSSVSGKGGGGGTAPPPSSVNPHFSANRSFKKPNNVQGVQSRVGTASVNLESDNRSTARTLQNGAHPQPPLPLHGPADVPVAGVSTKPTADMPVRRSAGIVKNAPTSQSTAGSSDAAARATPAKSTGDASKSFPLQFGSISPGFVNGMQIPARTSSAPPNLDEQKRDQARHAVRPGMTFPIPSVPKQQTPRKGGGAVNQSNADDAYQMYRAKRDVQVSAAPPMPQTQKATVHPVPGVSMPLAFHQPQVPLQFGVPNPLIQSQAPMAMPILPIGNAPQLQQQVFVSNLQPHPMQHQGIMHQSHSLNFTTQMSPQLPPQLCNLGISMGPQFAQHQAGKFGGHRKLVKITHPDTREELRLDESLGPKSHSNAQSQPITSVVPAHSINYHPSSYNSSSLFFPTPSSVPLTNAQVNPSSQSTRFGYPVSQSPQPVSFMNPSTHTSYSSKNSAQMHGIAEPSGLDPSRDVHNAISSAPSASLQVTVKPASVLHGEKVDNSSMTIGSICVEKAGSPKFFQQPGEVSSLHSQRDSDARPESSSLLPKPRLEPKSSSLPLTVKQYRVASLSLHTSVEESASAVVSDECRSMEAISRSDPTKDLQNEHNKRGHPPPHQVSTQCTSISGLPSSLQLSDFSGGGTSETADAKTVNVSSSTGESYMSARQPWLSHGGAVSDALDIGTNSERGPTHLSSKEFHDPVSVDSLDAEHHARQNDSILLDEPQKLRSMGIKEQAVVLNEEPKREKNNSNTSSDFVSIRSSEVASQAEQSCAEKITAKTGDVESQEPAQALEKKPIGHIKDDKADNGETSNSKLKDSTNAERTSQTGVLSTVSHGDNKTSSSDASFSRSNSLGSTKATLAKSPLLSGEIDPVFTSASISESSLKFEGDGTVNIASLASPIASSSKEKPVLEPSGVKNAGSRGKKKRKEFLQRADAAGASLDLYMAYKGPEERKDTAAPSEGVESTSANLKLVVADGPQGDVLSSERGGQSKSEPDDWEDAADVSTPKLEGAVDRKQVYGAVKHHGEDGVVAKKYSRDFLLKFSEWYIDLPDGFEITADIAEILIVYNVNISRESYPSPGRIVDRPSGGYRPDGRGGGLGDDDKWIRLPGPVASGRDSQLDNYGGNLRPGQGSNYGVLRNPRSPSGPYGGGILSAPMQSLGLQRNNSDSERWLRSTSFQRGLIPSPQTPLQVMHKAEKKYEVGKVTDEEQAKQRQLKAILNKLTPQNFEKLFEQVKEVNIDNATTLAGVISQIFDKALMEPTFCEMYANFCYHLAGELPDFSEDNEKITFKRWLLNKCQEEFERGEREQEEANKADEEGGVKQSEGEREEKRIRARRRMLGNIRLIGELYKKKMLTERIMHGCIKKLLGQYQNPDEEDIEALCKLMSTIGEIIDHPMAKEHMNAYFDMMGNLSNNMELSSRVRFMLKDAIDLRKNKWQQRRKVEGPKKIEEVHRDAAQERQVQASRLVRGPGINPSVRSRQPMDISPRGSSMLSAPNTQMGSFRGLPPQRGYGNQNVRMEDRDPFENRTLSVPLPQRPIGDDSITLGPQGGLARGMSIRGHTSVPSIPSTDVPNLVGSRRIDVGLNGYKSVSERTSYALREDLMQTYVSDRLVSPSYEWTSIQDRNINHGNRDLRVADRGIVRPLPTFPPAHRRGSTSSQIVSSDKVLPEERLRDMSMAAIKEFYSAKDKKEVAQCVKDLNAPSFYPTMISVWVTDSFERMDGERDLLAKLLIDLTRSQGVMLNRDDLMKGFESVLYSLEDAVNDAPKAAEFLGCIFAKIILENVVSFTDIGQLILEGGEEQGRLVEIGLAAEVVATVLETVNSLNGESALNDIRTGSSLKLEKFRPPNPKKSLRLDKFI